MIVKIISFFETNLQYISETNPRFSNPVAYNVFSKRFYKSLSMYSFSGTKKKLVNRDQLPEIMNDILNSG